MVFGVEEFQDFLCKKSEIFLTVLVKIAFVCYVGIGISILGSHLLGAY